jgi:hypothetical protein
MSRDLNGSKSEGEPPPLNCHPSLFRLSTRTLGYTETTHINHKVYHVRESYLHLQFCYDFWVDNQSVSRSFLQLSFGATSRGELHKAIWTDPPSHPLPILNISEHFTRSSFLTANDAVRPKREYPAICSQMMVTHTHTLG